MSWKDRAVPVPADSGKGSWRDRATPVSDDDLQRERPKATQAESFGRGVAQGASLGFIDEATAFVGAAKDVGAAKLGLRGDVGFGDAYNSYIGGIRAKDDAARADNPKTYLGGNVVGGIATTLVPGVGIAKSASFARGVGKAAVLGGATGAGLSEANPFESPDKLKEFAKDTGTGAAVGGVLQGGFGLLGKGLTALKPTELRKLSNVKALKAGGAIGSDLKKLGPERVQQIGEELHKNGVVKAFQSIEDFAAAAGKAKQDAGNAIGSALESVDDLVKQSKELIDAGAIGGTLPQAGKDALKNSIDKQFQFNMGQIGKRIQKELIEPNLKNPLLKGEMGKLSTIADDFISAGKTSLKEGNVIKGTQGKVTNFNSDTVPQAFKKEIYGIIRTHLDDLVAKTGNLEAAIAKGAGKAVGSADDIAARNSSVSSAYSAGKKSYGAMKEAEKIAVNRQGMTQGNNEFGLPDLLVGVSGAATGGLPAAVALGAGSKLARKFGDSAMSVGARKLADIIEKAPKVLGKFTGLIEDAASKGAPALESAHLALRNDPDYARILQNYEKSQAFTRRMRK